MDRQHGTRATISDVARVAGVSRQTISNVLNNPERVRPETRERVLAVIDEQGYRPNAAAKQLRQRRAHALGIELDVTGNRRVSGVLTAFLVESVLAARTHRASIVPFVSADHERPEPEFDDLVRRQMVDGFIIVDTRLGDPRPAWLRERGIPFVSFGRVWDDPEHTAWADVDGAAGTATAVEHLVAGGAHQVAFLGWPSGSPTGDERRLGWQRATRAAGIEDPSLVQESVQDVSEATLAAAGLVRRLNPGDAIVCASDELAMGALRAARAAGLTPGLDCSVVGFDDGPLAEALGLTTLRQPVSEIAQHLVAVATGLGDGDDPPAHGRLALPTLIVRATSIRRATPEEEEGRS
ncbi:hypothetical protein BA895_08080 [Humibacillus sp. DSM 29435]|uniref:LacI family DNA-binding transcriptional regulator n=1 Tax=Humibacillus sp. DSM 29435 TaxID=1869167 RepID=UPI0008727F69|nr:LacI family DNA-binding transcriptional regulator [Humibacillus sp. DSM 29435]OFE15074.1 hypothetical protein BA895_08080 [Humibacillus sp. DSM 29435]